MSSRCERGRPEPFGPFHNDLIEDALDNVASEPSPRNWSRTTRVLRWTLSSLQRQPEHPGGRKTQSQPPEAFDARAGQPPRLPSDNHQETLVRQLLLTSSLTQEAVGGEHRRLVVVGVAKARGFDDLSVRCDGHASTVPPWRRHSGSPSSSRSARRPWAFSARMASSA